ncbi:dihydrodipicolinate synthase family protein [Mammaliicoccus vitulinus]|uniref:dihydrodipicolinate synthase family protein n=1 Tax=Mammaliicoccus vitulinus TaxID=71237 RepID=UPI0019501A88|nr:dihydrodipicolinate synthase family protein [Mammaliicoccus vitulinus]MBM6630258.1 dihydrodipicolinate synthase family protein [Mammaliicoccus vitulinus]WQK87712.1 dihydrodipicolinate synthase family protein [Mammaliicoccus vitulinus]
MKNKEKWSGVFPAVLVPFNDDDSIDEQSFRDLVRWVANHDGVKGIVVNGHTGEIMTLLPEERAKIVSLAVDELQGKLPVISGVSAEGTIETIQHAQAVEKAGGEGILLMPPHSWLRFSMQDDSPSNYFKDVADAINIGIVVHQYPADTKASYSTEQLLKMAKIPNVVAFKLGERDMATYELHVRNLQKEAPDCAILTCHDEYLLPTLVQGIEGALVGFGCFVPDLISDLVHHVKNNDIASAKNTYDEIFKLKHAIYKMDQPSSSSHLRMKEAMYQRGIIKTNHARKPVEPLTQEEKDEITEGLKTVGLIN